MKASLQNHEELLERRYHQMEKELMLEIKAKEQDLLRKQAELAEARAELQAQEKVSLQQTRVRSRASYVMPLGEKNSDDRENIFTSALGSLGVLGRGRSSKSSHSALSGLPTPPTTAPSSTGILTSSNRQVLTSTKSETTRATGSGGRPTMPALRRVQSVQVSGSPTRTKVSNTVEALVQGFQDFAVTPSPARSRHGRDYSMMHISP
ncbi:uncharacterized protein EV422DRAFT_124518 [Fimicolochytrium jonesii]|uniref:uncharacterized protein n=1 Tax=Fimicolochytrium jonesii TaxID=1396493 RepID=UPI0022FDD7C0|nr:uncharacterized protein EV422DRAFT_124518 [Fimicolochytrium jonesii]KAI8818904.1 hypothetical protein EV422DRAFT_124518 [Fimicolochytrium jonesii]